MSTLRSMLGRHGWAATRRFVLVSMQSRELGMRTVYCSRPHEGTPQWVALPDFDSVDRHSTTETGRSVMIDDGTRAMGGPEISGCTMVDLAFVQRSDGSMGVIMWYRAGSASSLAKGRDAPPGTLVQFVADQFFSGVPGIGSPMVEDIYVPGVTMVDSRESAHLLANARDGLLRTLAMDPDLVSTAEPIEFEAAIGALLVELGYVVRLTVPSGDGGADLVASLDTPAGPLVALVQCKRRERLPVLVDQVRSFAAVVDAARVNHGIFVTSTRFSRGARKWVDDFHPYRISLVEKADLCGWLTRTASKPGRR